MDRPTAPSTLPVPLGTRLLSLLWRNAGLLVVIAALLAILKVWVPAFFTVRNVEALALSVSTVGMVACTMLFCLASGDFDLSIESVVAASGVLAAVVINATDSIPMGIAGGVLAGGVVGLVNGILIAKLRINALIATLATMQIVRGLGFIISKGEAVAIYNDKFFPLGTGSVGPIPNPVFITLLCFVFFGILLIRTTLGPNTLAIGGNAEAARLAGIPVDRLKVLIFTMQGLMAGLAGVVLAARMTSGQPNCSVGLSLDVISACVLGGVSLSGGVGTIHGVVIGVLVMGAVQNAMNLKNVETFYQYVARGVILLAAVLFDQIRRGQGAGTWRKIREWLPLG